MKATKTADQKYEIIFSDIDGTLLDDRHAVSGRTKAEIRRAVGLGIPFVLVSSRMPEAILAVQDQIGIAGPIVCYGGGLILDEEMNVLYSSGIPTDTALSAGRLIEAEFPAISWNAYAYHTWRCALPKSLPVLREEGVVGLTATGGRLEDILRFDVVHKFLCMGEPPEIAALQRRVRERFPELTTALSAPYFLEVSGTGVNKGSAVEILCEKRGIPVGKSLAFGDNFNDLAMLETAGTAFVMKNAPEELRRRFPNVAESNNDDGLALVLQKELA